MLEFYRTLAQGGVGTVVTEALRIQPEDPFGPGALVIFDRTALEGLRRIADVCHSEGALLIGQLNMGGRQEIRRCIACNQCWAWIASGEPLGCATNPTVGREYLWPKLEYDQAEFPRHVVVIGGGPAGLEAARVAAGRGHRVTLFEREDGLGGRLRHVHEVPYFEEMRHLLDYLLPEMQAITVHLGDEASVKWILAEDPSDIVIATGATAFVPSQPSDGSVPMITTDRVLSLVDSPADHVVIMDEDDYYWTAMVIESVIAAGKIPIVVTRFF